MPAGKRIELPGHRTAGLTCAVLSTALSSLAIIFQVSATKSINPLALAALSNLAGGAAVGAIVLTLGLSFKFKLLFEHKRDLLLMILLRNFFGALLFWYGLSLTLGIKAMFFTKAEPYFILGWNWLLDRRSVPKRHLLLLLVHVFGAIVLSVGDFTSLGTTQTGDFVLIFAVAILGLSYRFGARLAANVGALQTTVVSQLIGGSLMLPIGLWSGLEAIDHTNVQAWTHFLWAVLLWNVFGVVFWFLALQRVETWIVSALRALGPVIAAPVAWLAFSERLTTAQLLGGVVVLGTSVLIARESSGNSTVPEADAN